MQLQHQRTEIVTSIMILADETWLLGYAIDTAAPTDGSATWYSEREIY